MSLLKKTVSYLVIITMLLSLAVYAQDTQTTEVEIIDEAEIEIEFLKTLGIINERDMGQYIPSNTITRAEFSYMAVKMLGLGEGIELPEEETGFEDVSASHWAAPYIYKASISGIISGNGDGMFNPDQPVLYVQAIRMLVSALGYNVRAELSGGYPVGYLMIAQDKGITLPVSMDSELKNQKLPD